MKRKIGFYLFLFTIVYGIGEVWYFGINLTPKSDFEFICDFIFIGLLFTSHFFMTDTKKPRYENE